MSASGVPQLARTLGYLGLLPPLLLLAVPALGLVSVVGATRVMLVYVATVLAFLGGAQWAFALAQAAAEGDYALRRLIVGVLSALWAAASLLLPAHLCSGSLITGLVLLMAFETVARNPKLQPDWYLALRLRLTAGLILCLLGFALIG